MISYKQSLLIEDDTIVLTGTPGRDVCTFLMGERKKQEGKV